MKKNISALSRKIINRIYEMVRYEKLTILCQQRNFNCSKNINSDVLKYMNINSIFCVLSSLNKKVISKKLKTTKKHIFKF